MESKACVCVCTLLDMLLERESLEDEATRFFVLFWDTISAGRGNQKAYDEQERPMVFWTDSADLSLFEACAPPSSPRRDGVT